MTHKGDFKDGRDEAVSRVLDRMGMVEPPAELKANVLRAIDARRPEPGRIGWIEGLRESFRRRPLLGAIYPFVAGAAAAAIVFTILSGGARFDRAGALSGAMAPVGSGASGDVGSRIDDQRYEVNGANVHLTTVRNRNDLKARVEARSSGDVEITLKFDPHLLQPVMFTQGHDWEGVLESGSGWLRIHQRGNAEVKFVFDAVGAGDAPIQVTILAGGGNVQGVLRTGSI